MKRFYLTLDLEPDYGGLIEESYHYCDVTLNEPFFEIIDKFEVPLTIFVTGKILELELPILDEFKKRDADFHLHSYSHDLNKLDSLNELQQAVESYKLYFGNNPIGYRAPQGRISQKMLSYLKSYDFKFDASLFPTFWPEPKNIFKSQKIKHLTKYDLYQVPFSVLLGLVPASQSYLNLLGWNTFKTLLNLNRFPEVWVYNIHLHDLYFDPVPFNKLSPNWKKVYKQTQEKKLDNFSKLFKQLENKGYLKSKLNIENIVDQYAS